MHTQKHIYHHDDLNLEGYIAYDDRITQPRPAILVFHDWSGCNDFAREKARDLAQLGYVGFAVDMYGEGQLGESNEDKMALIQPLMENRTLLQQRTQATLSAVQNLEVVDASRIAAIGFCFGGLCGLDLARSGADIRGVVSFHGLLQAPTQTQHNSIKAKILALHGHDDPMVPPEQVSAFSDEMTQANVDWQLHVYGHTLHAFTNPKAHDSELGTIYNAMAEQRSLSSMKSFLEEVLA